MAAGFHPAEAQRGGIGEQPAAAIEAGRYQHRRRETQPHRLDRASR